jgi:putative DNA primase/helicase
MLSKDQHVLACWESPTGSGLKVLVRVPADASKHEQSFKDAEAYLKSTYGLVVDSTGKNLSRISYVSYDPNLFVRDSAEFIPAAPPEIPAAPQEIRQSAARHVEILVPESTDLGRAQRFVSRFGNDILYVYAFKQWYVFEDGRWNTKSDGAIQRLTFEICKESVAAALMIQDKDDRKAALSAATAWGSMCVMGNMLEAAQNDRRVIADPSELDADPWIVGARNGICDLRTGEIREHSRDRIITRCLGADFDPAAECPLWEKFIADIFADEDVRRFIQKEAGYCLTGLTTEHFFAFLYGMGMNGKSTFLDTLMVVFGDYSGKAGPKLIYRDRNGVPDDELAELFGKRFIVASETQEGAKLNEGPIKDLTGGDPVRARHKYGHGFVFKPVAKFWLMGNHKPAISGTDDGIWRRVQLIPFEKQFPPGTRDETLRDKLRGELPGIINWLIDGCLLWQQEGLNPPEVVRAAVNEYRVEEDTFGAFLRECTEKSLDRHVGRAELHDRYKQWARDEGVLAKDTLTMTTFNKNLREPKIAVESKSNGERMWRGISLK